MNKRHERFFPFPLLSMGHIKAIMESPNQCSFNNEKNLKAGSLAPNCTLLDRA